jgi:hypothetical protein
MLALRSYGALGGFYGADFSIDYVDFDLRPASSAFHSGLGSQGVENVGTSIGGGTTAFANLRYHATGRFNLKSGESRLVISGPDGQYRILSNTQRLYIEGVGGVAPLEIRSKSGKPMNLVPDLSPGGSVPAAVSLNKSDSGLWAGLTGSVKEEIHNLLLSGNARCLLTSFDPAENSASYRIYNEEGAYLEFTLSRENYLPRSIRWFAGGLHRSTLTLDYSPAALPEELAFQPLEDAIPAEVNREEFDDLVRQSFGEMPITVDFGPETDTEKEF